MKLLLGLPLIFLVIVAIILAVAFSFVYRIVKRVRKIMNGDYTDEEIERLSKKYHKDTQQYNFSKDYFKRSTSSSSSAGGYQADSQPRTAKTDQGFTIIDERAPQARRKIFDSNDGEYVDFKEE